MSTDNFIPTVWSAEILDNLDDDLVYANCMNRDYEGNISSFGDTVKINSLGYPTVFNYTKGVDMPVPEELDDAQQTLIINQSKGFNFAIDNIDKRQQNPKLMGDATKNASYVLARTSDDFIAALLAANIASANALGDKTIGFQSGEQNPYELLVDLDVQLTENNVPRDGKRWAVIPAWYDGALRKDDRYVSYGTPSNVEHLRGKFVGEASGFQIKISNRTPTSGSHRVVIAGWNGAATYAEQISDVQAYKPERRFADALKGLHLYGAKVTRPYALASANIIAA